MYSTTVFTAPGTPKLSLRLSLKWSQNRKSMENHKEQLQEWIINKSNPCWLNEVTLSNQINGSGIVANSQFPPIPPGNMTWQHCDASTIWLIRNVYFFIWMTFLGSGFMFLYSKINPLKNIYKVINELSHFSQEVKQEKLNFPKWNHRHCTEISQLIWV